MSQTASVRTPTHRTTRTAGLGLVIAVAAIIGTFVSHRPASSSTPRFSEALRDHQDVTATEADGAIAAADGAIAAADGVLPDGTTVFDDRYPGVANLDPNLLYVLREAATDAAEHGIEFHVNSGWRSPYYQNQLLRDAVSEYGSEEEAARWVATADTSVHVSGNAVDIGPFDATTWMSEHGAAYGLCQIYDNEPWHYELRPEAMDRGCPPMYADPTHDPRMQQ